MNRSQLYGYGLVLAIASLTGCSQNGTPVSSSGGGWSAEQASVSGTLASTPDLIDDGQMESEDVGLVNAGPAAEGALAAIRPYRFWRTIDGIERRFEFAFADSDSAGLPRTAVVTVHKTLRGSFNIVAGAPGAEDSPRDSSRRIVRKRLVDHWTRRVLLKRVERPNGEGGEGADNVRWRVAATSAVKVRSALPANDADHAKLLSLRVQSGALDTTLSNPLEFFRLRGMLKLDPGAEVAVTVTTERPDDIVLFVRHGHRARLEPNGDNTYSGRFTVPDERGVRHFGVNALSNGTLFDDDAPYNSIAWIFPYTVVNEEMAEYRP